MATPESSLAPDAVSLATAAPRVSYAFARSHGVFPLRDEGDAVLVVARDDASVEGIAELKRVLQRPLKTLRVGAERFAAELATAYNQASTPAAQFSEAEFGENLSRDADLARLLQDIPKTEDLLGSTSDAPVIRMINALLLQALRERASDIHFEPYEIRSVVRFRVDGVLRDIIEPPRALHAALVSRLKVMASLDIAEKRLPQDGRIALKLGDKSVDVRVSTLPTGPGERVVLRLLDKQAGRLDLTQLGMDAATLAHMDRLIKEPHGIVLVTGPTGSGKTTTLYAALSRLDTAALNIMTVEDPIEYDLDGISQTPINARIDMSFARALRTILRQDPDVVMIGEIRDLETAQIAVQASLTGHLVFATLHTNDAVSAVTRLVDMGVEPFLLASSLIGVGAQRLVRRLCLECRKPITRDGATFVREGSTFYSAQGCPACNRSGYRGRTGIYELLTVDDDLRRLIHDRASEQALRAHVVARGMKSLRDDGMRWAAAGVISLEEAVRVTRE